MNVRGTTTIIGVFGWPVKHSFSPAMQQAAIDALGIDWAYIPFPVHPDKLEQALRALPALGIAGVNCTIPHKEQAARIVDELGELAEAIGAVNTVTVLPDGRLRGDNTDADGFLESLRLDGGFEPEGKTVVQIGTGGAGRAMAFALIQSGVKKLVLANRTVSKAVTFVNDLKRTGSPAAIEAVSLAEANDALRQCDLLINSTSLGLKEGDPLPADLSLLPQHASVYDAVYTPLWTQLLRTAQQRGLNAIPGLGMLARQGARSLELWTGMKPDVGLMIEAVKKQLKA